MQDQLDDAFINDIRNQQFPRQQDFNEPPPKKESHPENQIGEESKQLNQNNPMSIPNNLNNINNLNAAPNSNIMVNNIDLNQNNLKNNINNNSNINNTTDNSTKNNNNTINVINNPNPNQTNEANKTKLENKFSFWYRISDDIAQYQAPKQALDKKIYETQVKKIHEFDTVEEFWGVFQHLRKPDSCKPGIEFMMFKEPIKPMWEDESNKNGGKISIKLRKQFTTIIWEEMIFALIGGILPKEMKEEINGIVVTSRKEFNTLQIWFKTYDDRIVNDLEQCIRGLLVIPEEVNLEIKQFNKSKKENNNEKKSGNHYNKGYNYNYYDDGYDNYKEEKNYNKKNKHHNHNNKNK